MSKFRLATLAFFILVLIVMSLAIQNKSNSNQIQVFVSGAPYSSDPIEYDSFVHHVVFRSVYSSLVTQYKKGEYLGILTDNWQVLEDGKKWIFHIKESSKFENGDFVTPEIISKNFHRLAFVMQNKKSTSDFFKSLKGFKSLRSINDHMEGIQYTNHSLILVFEKAPEKLLETLSFGLYSVVHPSQWNTENGEWMNPKKVISNGPYKIEEWTENKLNLVLNKNYTLKEMHQKAFPKITINWDANQIDQADISMGTSIDNSGIRNKTFYGQTPSGMLYVHCQSWSHPQSPCHDIKNRKILREIFYKNLSVKPTFSFFPTVMSGVSEVQNSQSGLDIKFNSPLVKSIRHQLVKFRQNEYQTAFNDVIKKMSAQVGLTDAITQLPQDQIYTESEVGLKDYHVDIVLRRTGILIEDPVSDIRFMFTSKEGAMIPDSTGVILKEIIKENPNIQKINQEVWDQAIIWPLTHFATGLWVKENIDMSLINLVLPPTDFQFIGEK